MIFKDQESPSRETEGGTQEASPCSCLVILCWLWLRVNLFSKLDTEWRCPRQEPTELTHWLFFVLFGEGGGVLLFFALFLFFFCLVLFKKKIFFLLYFFLHLFIYIFSVAYPFFKFPSSFSFLACLFIFLLIFFLAFFVILTFFYFLVVLLFFTVVFVSLSVK